MWKCTIWASACIVKPTPGASAADNDCVICRNAPYGQVLVLPSQRLVHPAPDDDFVICRNAPYGQMLLLLS